MRKNPGIKSLFTSLILSILIVYMGVGAIVMQCNCSHRMWIEGVFSKPTVTNMSDAMKGCAMTSATDCHEKKVSKMNCMTSHLVQLTPASEQVFSFFKCILPDFRFAAFDTLLSDTFIAKDECTDCESLVFRHPPRGYLNKLCTLLI